MRIKSGLAKIVMLRLTVDDAQALDDAAARFCLTASEVARRAIRIGLGELEQIDIPGSRLAPVRQDDEPEAA